MKILVISPIPTHPPNVGNRVRIYNFISSLKEMGHEVFLAHIQRESGDEISMKNCWGKSHYIKIPYKATSKTILLLQKIKRHIVRQEPDNSYPLDIDSWYMDRSNKPLRGLARTHRFDAVIVEYVFFSKALNLFDKTTLKIIDTHDVISERHAMFINKGLQPVWFSTTKEQEARGLSRADIIIAIQEKEKQFFRSICDKQTITVGHLTTTRQTRLDLADRNRLLYVGSQNEINIKSFEYFMESILPIIKKKNPDIRIMLAGKICNCVSQYNSEVSLLGEVNDMADAYSETDIVINPAIMGTGLCIKSIEPLGYGKPFVTTSEGARGLEHGSGRAFLVGNTPQEFANHIVTLLNDNDTYRTIAQTAYTFALEWNKEQISNLRTIFNEPLNNH